jgi:hypothetical protein
LYACHYAQNAWCLPWSITFSNSKMCWFLYQIMHRLPWLACVNSRNHAFEGIECSHNI